MAEGVFDEEIVALLSSQKLGGPQDVEDLEKVNYTTNGSSARMTSGTNALAPRFTVRLPRNGLKTEEGKRALLLEGALGAILDRHNMWGPSLKYPRIFMYGPRGGFACSPQTNAVSLGLVAAPSQWAEEIAAGPTAPGTLSPCNYDLIIWVSHCPDEVTVRGFGVQSAPTLQINLAYLDQLSRDNEKIPARLYRLTYSSGKEGGFDEDTSSIEYQFGKVQENLFGPKSPYTLRVDGEFNNRRQVTGSLGYVKTAIAALEKIVRKDPGQLGTTLVQTPSREDEELVYQAIMSGVLPYGRGDVADAEKRPDPVAGLPSNGDLMSIMTLLGYTPLKGALLRSPVMPDDDSAAAAASTAAAVSDRASPYASLSATPVAKTPYSTPVPTKRPEDLDQDDLSDFESDEDVF